MAFWCCLKNNRRYSALSFNIKKKFVMGFSSNMKAFFICFFFGLLWRFCIHCVKISYRRVKNFSGFRSQSLSYLLFLPGRFKFHQPEIHCEYRGLLINLFHVLIMLYLTYKWAFIINFLLKIKHLRETIHMQCCYRIFKVHNLI